MQIRALRIVALLLCVQTSAGAQELAGTFDQLRVLVKPGETLTITDAMGERTRGKLSELSPTSLVLDASGKSRAFAPADIDTIQKRGPDSLREGALIGLAIGGGLASILGLASSEARDESPGLIVFGALVYGGIGAGIGVGIDALVEGSKVIYAGSRANQTRIRLVPIVGRGRKGVLMSVRFSK